MAKIKLTKKEIPILSKELDLDETVVRELKKLQDSYSTKFEADIKNAQEEVLASYQSKIAALKEAKEKLTKEYDAEINKYTTLVKDLKGQPTKVEVETKKSKSAK
jgi:hypothetical protein